MLASLAADTFAQLPWSLPSTWPGGIVPGIGGAVGASPVIPAGATILFDLPAATLADLDVRGTLVFDDSADRTLTCDKIVVTGSLSIGSQATPFKHQARIELREQFAATLFPALADASLQVLGPAQFSAFGRPKGPTWTRLAQTAGIGSQVLTVQAPVSWEQNDRIVIASTDFDLGQAEVRQVSATLSGATVIPLLTTLAHRHHGATEGASFDGVGVEIRAEVGLLTHNVVIEGMQASGAAPKGGQTRFEADADGARPLVQVENVEFRYLGREGVLGEYPIHFHADSTVMGSASGSYVMYSSIHDCYNRFISIHHTDDVIVAHNVGYETIGHGYYCEDDSVTGCQIIENLGLGVRRVPAGGLHEDDHASVFWLQSPDNMVIGNAAAGSEWAGFWFDRVDGAANTVPWAEFRGNVAHSNALFGFFGDWRPRPATESVFVDCLAYKNRELGFWIRSYERHRLINCDAADNRAGHYFASEGYQVDQVGRDAISHITLEGSLIIGETTGNSATFPQLAANQPCSGRPFASPLVGVELYDGLVGIVDCVFAAFAPRTVTFPFGTPTSALREAGAISQIIEFNPWAVMPNNYAANCQFVNAGGTTTKPFFLRSPQGQITFCDATTRGDAGLANTMIFDKTGSITGLAGRYVVPNNPFLVPPPPATAVLDTAGNAFVVTGTRYGQLDLNVGLGLTTTLMCGNPVPTPPINGDLSATFTSLIRGISFTSTGALNGNFTPMRRIGRYHTNVVIQDAYLVAFSSGQAVRYLELSFQGAAPGDRVLVGVPMLPSASPCVLHNGQPGTQAASPFALITASGGSWAYDAPTQVMWMVFQLDPIGGGTTVHDSLSSTFRVLMP